jgi:cellulose synthase operon protein C
MRACLQYILIGMAIIATGTIQSVDARGKGSVYPKAPPPAKARSSGDELDALKLVEGDEKSNDMRAVKTELMISRTEAKAIEQIKRLLQKYRGSMMEPDLKFRLAELYMRRAKSARFFELNRQSETVIKIAPKVIANVSSRGQITNAVGEYESIQKRFPSYRQLDLVVFNNAFARQQLGQEREAERLYWTLVQKFADSPLVPDSHLAIGEISFERGNYSFALEHFNAIAKFPDSRVYPYGLYKAAWALYNMRKGREALEKLEEVVAYGKYVKENNIEARLDLRREALQDMTVFFEDVHPAQKAYSYFKSQVAELDLGPVLLKLAKIYERHSRHLDLDVVLGDFIKHLPESPLIAEIHSQLIWNFDAMKKKDRAITQLKKLESLCAEKKAAACREILSETSLKLASRWIKIWKKAPTLNDFADGAEAAYAVYLTANPIGRESSSARYSLAEMLFQRAKYRRASDEYAVVAVDKSAENRPEASYAAVLSLEKAVGDKWSDKDESRFRELAGLYLLTSPKGQYRLDLEFKMALIAYEKERLDEAGPVFLRLGREFAGQEKGKKAQDLYMDTLNLKKDFKGLSEYAATLLGKEMDSGRKGKIQKIHEQSSYMRVQSLEEAHKYAEAIEGYQTFATRNPRTELAEKAWSNSVQLHFKILDFLGGARAAEQFYDRFPTSKGALDALLKAAESYESLAKLVEAAGILLKVAKVDAKSAIKWKFLAADFYLLSGQSQTAKPILISLKGTHDRETSTRARDKLFILESEKRGPYYETLLKEIAESGDQPQASLAKAEQVEKLYAKGKTADAFNEAKKVVGATNGSASAKSRARLVQAKVLKLEFIQASVKAQADRVATVLALKTEKLDKAQQAFQQAIKYGDAQVAVESLRHQADCYLHFVDALKTMPLPAGISQDESSVFREELTKLSIPLEEKAIETLQEGVRAAGRWQIESQDVTDMKLALTRMNMPMNASPELELSSPGIMLPNFAGVNR